MKRNAHMDGAFSSRRSSGSNEARLSDCDRPAFAEEGGAILGAMYGEAKAQEPEIVEMAECDAQKLGELQPLV